MIHCDIAMDNLLLTTCKLVKPSYENYDFGRALPQTLSDFGE